MAEFNSSLILWFLGAWAAGFIVGYFWQMVRRLLFLTL